MDEFPEFNQEWMFNNIVGNSIERQDMLEQQLLILQRDNQSLKTQFQQALQISEQSKELRIKNDKLTRELREINNENNELKRRIETVSNSLNDERRKSMSEIEAIEANYRNQIYALRKENKELQENFQKSKEEYNTQISEKERQKIQNETKIQEEKNTLNNIIQLSSQYFQTTFKNVNDLIEHLQSSEQIQTIDSEEVKRIAKRANKYKKAIAIYQSKIEALEQENKNLAIKVSEKTTLNETTIREYQQKIIRIQDEHDVYKQEQTNQYNALEDKLESVRIAYLKLNDQLNETRKNAISINTSPIRAPPEPVLKRQVPQPIFDEDYSDDLRKQISELNVKNIELSNDIQNVKDQLNKSQIEIEKYKSEIKTMKHIRDEALAESQSLREALSKQTTVSNTPPKPTKEMQIAIKAKQLQKTLEVQKQHSFELQLELEKVKSQFNDKNNKIEMLESELEDYRQQLKKANEKLQYSEAALGRANESVQIPQSIWSTPVFDSDLSCELDKIGASNALQISSKVSNAFRVISEYYATKISRIEESNKKSASDLKSLETALDDLTVDIYFALNGEAPDPPKYSLTNAREIVRSVSSLKRDFDSLSKKSSNTISVFESFSKSFGNQRPADIAASFQQMTIELSKRRQQMKEMKSTIKMLSRKLSESQTKLNEKESEMVIVIQQKDADVRRAKDDSEAAEKRANALSQKLKLAEEQRMFSENTLKAAREEMERNSKEISSSIESAKNAEIAELNTRLEEANYQIEALQEENSRLAKSISNLHKMVQDRDSQVAEARRSAAEAEKASAERIVREREQLTESYESAIEELRAQNGGSRLDFQKVSDDLIAANKKLKESKDVLFAMKKEKFRLEAELTAVKEESERQKRIFASEKEVALAEAESAAIKREARKADAAASDRRELMAFVAKELADISLIDPGNDRCFRQGVQSAAEKIRTLERSNLSVRRLVCAANGQPTEDAVAQMLMK